MAVALEATLDEGAELCRKCLLVKEVVHAETRTARLGRVSGTDALAGRADIRPAELDLLEAVDDLVEVEDEVRSVRNEQATLAVQAWPPGRTTECQSRERRTSKEGWGAPFEVRASSSWKKAGM